MTHQTPGDYGELERGGWSYVGINHTEEGFGGVTLFFLGGGSIHYFIASLFYITLKIAGPEQGLYFLLFYVIFLFGACIVTAALPHC